MGAIAGAACAIIAQEGKGEVETFLRITNVTTGDTLDTSSITPTANGTIPGATLAYKSVKCGYFHVAGTLTTQAAATLGSPTTSLTLTLSSLSADTVYLAICGCA